MRKQKEWVWGGNPLGPSDDSITVSKSINLRPSTKPIDPSTLKRKTIGQHFVSAFQVNSVQLFAGTLKGNDIFYILITTLLFFITESVARFRFIFGVIKHLYLVNTALDILLLFLLPHVHHHHLKSFFL